MIKAITFDLDGVYFPNGKIKFIKNLVALGVPESEARRVFLQSDEMNLKYKTGQWTDEQFWSWALSEWKSDKTVPEIIKLLIEGYEVDPRVADLTRTVRVNGYKTLICSNNFPARIKGLQAKFGFLDDFDVVVLACEVGVLKPDKKIFEELIKNSGVRPDEIFYTDDSQAALDSAKELGIVAHYYENFEDFLATLKNLGININAKI